MKRKAPGVTDTCLGKQAAGGVTLDARQAEGAALLDESDFASRVPIKPVRIPTILATWEALHGAD